MPVILYNLQLPQQRYCTTCREMLAAVTMCTHFRSYLRGMQITLHTYHRSLRWLQKFCNSDGMLARWYILLRQLSVSFEYRPGARHANVDGLSRQCGQCLRPDCPVSSPDVGAPETGSTSDMPRRIQICCQNYPGKHGWQRPIWMRLHVIFHHPGRNRI